MTSSGTMLSSSDILYVDNHLLLVNKPAGLVTQPSGQHHDSLESRAKEWLRQEYGKTGNVFCEAVHRLDRPCSGIVLFARTSKALSRLNAAIRQGETGKTYRAVVLGVPDVSEGQLEHWLLHGSHEARVADPDTAGARRSRLGYRVLAASGSCSLVEIALETGRYHQIRVQFAAIGHPVFGDTRYGGGTGSGTRIALHHYCLRFSHPVQKDEICICAPVPAADPWCRFPGFSG